MFIIISRWFSKFCLVLFSIYISITTVSPQTNFTTSSVLTQTSFTVEPDTTFSQTQVSGEPTSISTPLPVSPPSWINITKTTNSSMDLVWEVVKNASGYRVMLNSSLINTTLIRNTNSSSENSLLVDSLSPGTLYSVSVFSLDIKGMLSSPITTEEATNPITPEFDIMEFGSTFILLNISNAEDTYNVTLNVLPIPCSSVVDISCNITTNYSKIQLSRGTFNLTQLFPGRLYNISALFSRYNKWSDFSSISQQTVPASPILSGGVSQFNTTFISINLTFSDTTEVDRVNITRIAEFNVTYDDFPITFNQAGQIISWNSLMAGSTFNISAVNVRRNIFSDSSNHIIQKTMLDTVKELKAGFIKNDSIGLTWVHATGLRDGYLILCDNSNGTRLLSNVTSYVCSNLIAGQNYLIRVITERDGFNSQFTQENFATTPNQPSLTLFVNSTDSILVTWPPLLGLYTGIQLNVSGTFYNISNDTSSYLVNGLTSNTYYYISARSYTIHNNETTISNFSDAQTTWTLADPVYVLSSLSTSSNSILLSWDLPSNQSTVPFYAITLSTEAGVCVRQIKLLLNNTSLTPKFPPFLSNCTAYNETFFEQDSVIRINITDLLPCTSYNAEVASVNPSGPSVSSFTKTTTKVSVPGAIRNLTVSVNESSIGLTWNPPYQSFCNLTHYAVSYSYTNCTLNQTLTGNISTQVSFNGTGEVVLSGLDPYTVHFIDVTAFTTAGPGPSISTNVTTLQSAPGPVQNLQSFSATNLIRFSWDPPLICERRGEISGYNFSYICEVPNNSSLFSSGSNSTEDTFLEINVEPYINCTLTVSAVTVKSGIPIFLSAISNETEPGMIAALERDYVNQTVISLKWQAPLKPNGKIISYQYFWLSNPLTNFPDNNGNDSVLETRLFIRNLYPERIYNISVAASTTAGRGPFSHIMVTTATGVPGAVENLKATAISYDTIEVSWSPPNKELRQGATNYSIMLTESAEPYTNITISNLTIGYLNNIGFVSNLDAFWLYNVSVQAKTLGGNGPLVSLPRSVRTLETRPRAPQNINFTPLPDLCQKPGFFVSWSCLQGKDRRGPVSFYRVFFNSSTSNVVKDVFEVPNCSTLNLNQVNKILPNAMYSIYVVAHTNLNTGFSSKTENRISPTCPPAIPEEKPGEQPFIQKADSQTNIDSTRQIQLILRNSIFKNSANGIIERRGLIVVDEQWNQGLDVNAKSITNRHFNSTFSNNWNQVSKDPSSRGFSEYRIEFLPNFFMGTYDNFTYVLGGAGDCPQSLLSRFSCNGYLQSNRKYILRSWSCTKAGCTLTKQSASLKTDSVSPVGTIVGSVFGVLIIILLVILIISFVVWRRKRIPSIPKAVNHPPVGYQNGGFQNNGLDDSMSYTRPDPIALDNFIGHVNTMKKDSNMLFSDEYKLIKDLSPTKPWTAAENGENRIKNRFVNILPFDHSRVKLLPFENEECSDYINANYMPGYSSRREFIAAQGPLPSTKDMFWRMLWEQKVPIVVMLTQCIERGRIKCEQYWPTDSEPLFYGDLEVQLRSESVMDFYVLRILDIRLGQTKRTIQHFHFILWPDFGCPETTELLLKFVQVVRHNIPVNRQGPVTIHCSAGVGRTGTFIAVDRLLQHIQDHDQIDVFGLVLDMREYRCNMVQTEDQYVYIHECISDALVKGLSGGRMLSVDDDGLYENAEMTHHIYENSVPMKTLSPEKQSSSVSTTEADPNAPETRRLLNSEHSEESPVVNDNTLVSTSSEHTEHSL